MGGLLAGATLDLRLFATGGIALFLYAAGLILNDLADAEIDQHERPERPLPSRRISHKAALTALWCCLCMAWILSLTCGAGTVFTTALLTLSILGYNLRLKHHFMLGPLSMGFCRGLSVCLGLSIADQASGSALVAALLWTAYIAIISTLAQSECTGKKYGLMRWGPAFILGTGFVLAVFFMRPGIPIWLGMLPFALALGLALTGGMRINIKAPHAIGLMLSSILPLQSATMFLAGFPLLSAAWLLLVLPATLCARYFKAS